MEQVYRIEIPIEAINATDASALRSLETALQRIYTSATKSKSAAQDAMNAINSGASGAASSMNKLDSTLDKTAQGFEDAADSAEDVGTAGEQAANEAGDAADKLGDDVEDVADSYEETGKAAKEAGKGASSAFNQAGQQVDKFTKRTEKSQQSLRKMFAQKMQLTLAAIDKVSPILKSVGTTVKGLTSKAWHVAVRMTDFVTAPFRKLVQMISSPIAMTISLAGVGLSASSFLNTFTEFSAGMSNVKALSGATEEEFARLTAAAENLGATTKFTAAEASQGMQYLAMAGWDTAEIIDAMPGMLHLAAAGATDLGTAADIVSDVMTAMDMQASEATRAANVFAKAATSTNTTIEKLGYTMKYAAPIAHTFGMTLEDVSAAAGLMANAGIKGEMAGTALRTSLLRMAKPTKEMQETMNALGISFIDDTGKMKSMSNIIKMLETSFSGLTQAEKLSTAQILFGTEASSAWIGLIGQGSKAYDELAASLYGASGAAEEMSNVQLDNLAGDMTILQSAVDGMKISLMKELNPYLRSGVQWITGKIPEIKDKLVDLANNGISKAKELKTFIKGVFDSSDYKNADGFAEKFFIAWDKIIAEPFDEWWSGNGHGIVLGIVEKVGSGLGQTYHGIIAGIFAALKGEEIDFEGMNLTGLSKAGAEAAKTFVESFKNSFDLGGLWDDSPGLLKAGAIGFGTFKIGGGAIGLVKTISQIRTAFGGAATTATAAAAATNGFGAAAATAATGTAKAATALSAIKAGLSAIPVWGWVAAAALAAVTVGIAAYKNAQKRHEQDLLNTGKAAMQMADNYVESMQEIGQAMDAMDTIKQIEIQLVENKGGNKEVIDSFKEEIGSINSRIVYLEAKIADGTLTKEEIETYQGELNTLEGRIAEVKAILEKGECTPEQVTNYQEELEALEGRVTSVKAVLEKGECTPEMIDEYQKEIDKLNGKTAIVVASLQDEGYDAAQVAVIQQQVAQIQEGEKRVTLIIADKTELAPDQIAAYVAQLSDLMTKKTEYELYIHGSELSDEEIKTYKDALDDIKTKAADIAVKINKGQGTMSDDDWQDLLNEATTLRTQASSIELILKGADANQEEVDDVKKKLADVRGEAAGIMLDIGYSPDSKITQDDLDTIAGIFSNVGEIQAQLNIGLANGSMGTEELEALNKQLNETRANLIEASGGYFTEEDVKHNRITQERYDNWLRNKQLEADTKRNTFFAQTVAGRENVPELVAAREEARTVQATKEADAAASIQDREFLLRLDQERKYLGSQYQRDIANGVEQETAYSNLMEGGRDLVQRLNEHEWAYYKSAPVAFESDQPEALFGKNVGGFWGIGSHWEIDSSVNPFSGAIGDLSDRIGKHDTATDQQAEKANAANAALVQQYQAEVRVKELDAFAGFGAQSEHSTQTIQQLAASYADLDSAGQQMFANAISGIVELNSTTDYITDAEKVNVQEILESANQSVTISANIEVIGDIKSKLTELSTAYQTASSDAAKADFNSANLEAVNSALEALGLEKINDLGELSAKLSEIAAIDPSGLNFDAATASLTALGGSTESVQAKVAAAQSQLTALAGTYNVTIKINTIGSIPSTVPGTRVEQNANGGIYDGAFLSWVAEDGPEAIIPLGSARRERGLDLWMQAGEMLGVQEFADGGIMAPYAGAIADLPDFVLDNEDAPAPIAVPTGNSGSHGQQTIEVSIDSSPTFEIKGGSPDDIMAALKSHMKELAELLGTEFAEQISDIVLNLA